jgi:hypothetical protein
MDQIPIHQGRGIMRNRRIASAAVALLLLGALSVSFYKQKYPKLVGSEASQDDDQSEYQDHEHVAHGEDTRAPASETEAISKVISEASSGSSFSVMSEAMSSNNPEVLKAIAAHDPDFKTKYGEGEWSLLHIASYQCSPEMVKALHKNGKLNWDLKAKDGTTPLTIAAEKNCLPVLQYWKDQKAGFTKADGRGKSALSILKKNDDDAALATFVTGLEGRKPASKQVAEVTFYRKRSFPSGPVADKRPIADPNVRPEEVPETAEFSEFAD